MSRTPVPFAPDTLESIRRAFRVASDRRHDLVSLEHMLHALLEDPQARDILLRCRVNLDTLRADLEEVLEKADKARAADREKADVLDRLTFSFDAAPGVTKGVFSRDAHGIRASTTSEM